MFAIIAGLNLFDKLISSELGMQTNSNKFYETVLIDVGLIISDTNKLCKHLRFQKLKNMLV